MGTIHAARIENSPRLRAVLAVLMDGREHTTRDLIRRTGRCAINSIVDELRENGYKITCERRQRAGRPVWYYRLEESDK